MEQNKLKILLLVSIIISFLGSCSKRDYPELVLSREKQYACLTKALKAEDYSEYILQEHDLYSYKKYMSLNSESGKGDVIEIIPYTHDGVVVCYIVNFERGWQVLSADKRGPIVLGEGKSNALSLAEICPAHSLWLDMMADDIEYRWYCSEDYYSSVGDKVKENENLCLSQWKAINADVDFINDNRIETKNNPSNFIILDPPGHYELMGIYNGSIVYDTIPHLMSTNWTQHYPYNAYIPLKSGSNSEHCPAGCVSIATAQVLNYLHHLDGVPTSSPTQGYCYGDENNYSMGFGDYRDTTWGYFGTVNDTLEFLPKFIGNVALLLQTDFGSSGSGAQMSNIVSSALPAYGLSATYVTGFDASIVTQNLLSGYPVIYGANRYESIFNWPGHAFVIDGYTQSRQEQYYVYHWVYDLPENSGGNYLLPIPPDNYTEIYYTGPTVLSFRINWGYGNYIGENDNDYSLSGIWEDPYSPGHAYQYAKEMVYGYALQED